MDISLQGNLGHFHLREMLVFFANGGRTGTLRLVGEDRETTAYLDSGAVVSSMSDHPDLSMPLVLARKQKIDKAQREALEGLVKSDGERFAQAAIKDGLFDADAMRDLAAEHVMEVIVDAMLWDGGSFVFSHDVELPDSVVPVSLKIEEILKASETRVAEWEECKALFPDANQHYMVVGDPESDENITLSVFQFKTLLRIKELGSASVQQMCKIIDREPLEIYRTLDSIRKSGLIAEAEEEVAPSPAPVPMTKPEPVDVTAETPTPDPEPEPTAPTPEPVIPPPPPSLGDAEPEATIATPLADFASLKAAASAAASESPLGVLTLDDENRTSYPLTESEYTVGRDASNKIQIADGSVSGGHARILRTPQGYLLEDLESRNGTYVNGERIQSRVLQNDDKLRLGKVHMIFNVP